jgi:hypothetical protein
VRARRSARELPPLCSSLVSVSCPPPPSNLTSGGCSHFRFVLHSSTDRRVDSSTRGWPAPSPVRPPTEPVRPHPPSPTVHPYSQLSLSPTCAALRLRLLEQHRRPPLPMHALPRASPGRPPWCISRQASLRAAAPCVASSVATGYAYLPLFPLATHLGGLPVHSCALPLAGGAAAQHVAARAWRTTGCLSPAARAGRAGYWIYALEPMDLIHYGTRVLMGHKG